MPKQYFFVRLIPPPPTFPFDMTDSERRLMAQHVDYTREHFKRGEILIDGPVLDPKGPFGMAVFEVEHESLVRAVLEKEPSVVGGLNTFEIHAMRIGGAQANSD